MKRKKAPKLKKTAKLSLKVEKLESRKTPGSYMNHNETLVH